MHMEATLLLFFQFEYLYSFPCLISLARASNTLLNRSGESFILFSILKKNFQLFTIEYNVCCGFVICEFYSFEVCFFYTKCVRVDFIEEPLITEFKYSEWEKMAHSITRRMVVITIQNHKWVLCQTPLPT